MSATGKWSGEECAAFLRGTAQYGTDWRAINTLVPTRSLVQIRSHAQKVNEKKKPDERHWTGNEKALFVQGLREAGCNWKYIAGLVREEGKVAFVCIRCAAGGPAVCACLR